MSRKKPAVEAAAAETPADVPREEVIKSIKGFDRNLKCRDFQFEIGKTYQHDGDVIACRSGFHAIDGNPLRVFEFYRPHDSRYATTVQAAPFSRDGDGAKVASAKITIGVELTLSELTMRAVNWVISRAKSATGKYAEGKNCLAAANGYGSSSAANGDRSSSAANGYGSSSAANGDRSSSAANGDGSSSAANGDGSSSAANGDRSSSAANGYGSSSAANGKHSVAMSAGTRGRAKGADGNALFLVFRDPDNGEILHAWAGIVGRDGIKPDTWYSLDASGKPQEVE